jgi:hypothetical protein
MNPSSRASLTELQALQAQRDAIARQRAETAENLVTALLRYVRHQPQCQINLAGPVMWPTCTCGLDALLTAPADPRDGPAGLDAGE